jgi:hypothetical protein
MPERGMDELEQEILLLRSALEQALLFVEEVAAGQHERFEAEALVDIMRNALEPEADTAG